MTIQHNVKELMNPTPDVIDYSATIREAARHMYKNNCGALPVSKDSKICGMLTDRDITVYGIALDADPDETTVEDIMSNELFTCYDSDTLEQVADKLSDNDVRRLVVCDSKTDQPIGIISITDIIKSPDDNIINDNVVHHLFKYS